MTSGDEFGPWWLPLWARFLQGDALGIHAPRSTIGAMLIAAQGSKYLHSLDDITTEIEALSKQITVAAAATNAQATSKVELWNHVCTYGLGLTGDRNNYHDPRNSFLPDIRRRSVGIPIGLALVWLHAANLLQVEAYGVGMPGHFLVCSGSVYIDCFNGGQILTEDGCQLLYQQLFGDHPAMPFNSRFLDPATDDAMFVRMTANLKQHAARSRDLITLTDLARLRWFLPLPSLDEGRELVRLCVAVGAAVEAQHWFSEVQQRFGSTYPEAQLAGDQAAVRAALN